MTQYAELDLIRTCRPVCLPPTATVMMAARHMHSRNVSAVLVTDDDGSLVGIFTERDAISRVLAEGKDPVATFLGEVMTDNPDTVRPDESPAQVVSRMPDWRFCHPSRSGRWSGPWDLSWTLRRP